MNLMRRWQYRKWRKSGQYAKIEEALEAIPDGERTPEMDCELANALLAVTSPEDPGGRETFRRCAALLEAHADLYLRNSDWHVCLGNIRYGLDDVPGATRCFETALAIRPRHSEARQMLMRCHRDTILPRFFVCFRDRVESFWKEFAGEEAQLRQALAEEGDGAIRSRIARLLDLVSEGIVFETAVRPAGPP